MKPSLRFPEFNGNGDWTLRSLSLFIEEYREASTDQNQYEVLTSSRFGLVRQREYFDNDRIAERSNVGFNVIPPEFITYRSRSDNRSFYFNENSLGVVGLVSIYYPVFRIKNGSNRFFVNLLNSKSSFIGRFSVGTSQTVLSLNELRRIKLAVPELAEQEKIANFLSAVDERIKLLQRQLAALAQYKKSIMQRLFDRSLRFNRSDGTAFPNWNARDLGSVFDWISTNSLSREMLTYEKGKIQNIHYGDIHGKFSAHFRQSAESVPFIRSDALPSNIREDAFCKIGDVIIVDASEDYTDIGKAVEVIEVASRSLVAGLHTYIARPKAGVLALGFAAYLFQSQALREQIMRIAQGISVLSISKPNLSKLKLCLPHPDEQRRIADFLSTFDDKIAAASAKIAQTEAFKKGLLQKMFV